MKAHKTRRSRTKPAVPSGFPKSRFVVFCEGQNTEPRYFFAIRRAFEGAVLEVRPGIGVPLTVASMAVEHLKTNGSGRRRRRGRSAFEARDEVWAVFDRDQHPNFDAAVRICEQNGVHIGLSNPCFELWLVLHHQDHNRPESTSGIQSILSKLHPEYDRHRAKTLDFDSLVARVGEAEQRAMRQLDLRAKVGDRYGNPSTRVGSLTLAIRHAHDQYAM